MCTRCVTYRIIIIIDIDWSQQNNWTDGSCTYNDLYTYLYYFILLFIIKFLSERYFVFLRNSVFLFLIRFLHKTAHNNYVIFIDNTIYIYYTIYTYAIQCILYNISASKTENYRYKTSDTILCTYLYVLH